MPTAAALIAWTWFRHRGLLNGLAAPIAFVGSLFSPAIRIYAFPNSGVWYDLGFLLGLAAWGGGAAASGGGDGR